MAIPKQTTNSFPVPLKLTHRFHHLGQARRPWRLLQPLFQLEVVLDPVAGGNYLLAELDGREELLANAGPRAHVNPELPFTPHVLEPTHSKSSAPNTALSATLPRGFLLFPTWRGCGESTIRERKLQREAFWLPKQPWASQPMAQALRVGEFGRGDS